MPFALLVLSGDVVHKVPFADEVLAAPALLMTALWATGALAGFVLAGQRLALGSNPYRLVGDGILAGFWAFSPVIFSARMSSSYLFYAGALMIGFGGGLVAVSTLMAAMTMPATGTAGRKLAPGAWGAALMTPDIGYSFVYHTEIGLLFVTVVILGLLVQRAGPPTHPDPQAARLGLADLLTCPRRGGHCHDIHILPRVRSGQPCALARTGGR